MSGAIFTQHFVEHMSGGVHSGPGWCSWEPGSACTIVLGPTVTNAFPGSPAYENQGSDVNWLSYNTSIGVGNSVDGVTIFCWHRDIIYALDNPPNFTAVHTCTSMRTDASSRYGGDHSGLYIVHSKDGQKQWVCGFYRTTTDTLGILRYDTKTDTWNSYDTGNSHAGQFSICMQWKNVLAHANFGRLLLYDPESDELISRTHSGGDFRDWIWVNNDRLFIIYRTSANANLAIVEYAYGSFAYHGTVLGTTENTVTGGGWSVLNYTDDGWYIVYYTTTGGNGWRADFIQNDTSPGSAITKTDATAIIPDGTTGISNHKWPGPGASKDTAMFFPFLDASESPRGAFGATGGLFSRIRIQSTKFGPPSMGEWVSGSLPITVASPSGGTNLRHSQPITRYGRGDRDSNGTGPWIESIEAYADGTITRGALVKFRVHNNLFGPKDFQFLYSKVLGEKAGPGFNIPTLSVGDGIDLGGTAVLNAPENSVDDIMGSYYSGGDYHATLSHDAPSGTGFQLEEQVTGDTSGVIATIKIINTTNNRLGVNVTSGTSGGFVAGETITGGASGTTAMLTAPEDTDPLYQIIWNLDADSISDFSHVEVSTVLVPISASRPPVSPNYTCGPVQILQIPESIDSELATFDNSNSQVAKPFVLSDQTAILGASSEVAEPVVVSLMPAESPSQVAKPFVLSDQTAILGASSEVAEPAVLSSAAPYTTSSPVAEPAVVSTAAPYTTSSPVEEPLSEADVTPETVAKVEDRPSVRADGVQGIQIDSVEIGARDELNLVNTTLPGQRLVFDPVGPTVKWNIDGVVELGRASFDATNPTGGTLQEILDLSTAGVETAIVHYAVVIADNVSGVSVQPTLSVGTDLDISAGASYDNQINETSLNLTATGEGEDIFANTVSKMAIASNNDIIYVQIDGLATATTYDITVVVYGRATLL